ncbi:Variable outer membrane protein, partial (plasmid) [Borrelia coriaceae ATCC 43381]
TFGGVLGFNAETKKSKVGDYFKTIKSTVEDVKSKLNAIVENMKNENNPNAAAVETAVKKLVTEKLEKIIEGAHTVSEAIGIEGNDLIGNVAKGGDNAGVGDKGTGVDSLVKGIKEIVEVVLKEGNYDAGTDKKASDGNSSRTSNGGTDEAGKLFGNTGNNGGIDSAANAKKSAADAAKAVGAVTGADILQAIVKDGGDAAQLASSDPSSAITKGKANDATIAGAIALRAMAKGGKFANTNASATPEVVTAVKDAAISAVTKALGTLTITIRKTIDAGLKTVKDAMKINPDATPVISETGAADK